MKQQNCGVIHIEFKKDLFFIINNRRWKILIKPKKNEKMRSNVAKKKNMMGVKSFIDV